MRYAFGQPPPSFVPDPPAMALLTLAVLFLSFDFAVVGAAHLIRAFIASNNQVKDLRAHIPRGAILNIDRSGEVIPSISRLLSYLSLFAQTS